MADLAHFLVFKAIPAGKVPNLELDLAHLKYFYRFGFRVFHSATGGTMPRETISSRILQR